jgi:hypothetical protein
MRVITSLLIMLAAGPGIAEQYNGDGRLWFTLAAMPLQATGTGGHAKGMERFPEEVIAFRGLNTECFGWADEQGLGTGHCLNIAPNGDLWFEKYTCETHVLPPPGVLSACDGTLTVLGGTGQFAAIAGSGRFTMLTTILAPDGMQIIYAPGELDLSW